MPCAGRIAERGEPNREQGESEEPPASHTLGSAEAVPVGRASVLVPVRSPSLGLGLVWGICDVCKRPRKKMMESTQKYFVLILPLVVCYTF